MATQPLDDVVKRFQADIIKIYDAEKIRLQQEKSDLETHRNVLQQEKNEIEGRHIVLEQENMKLKEQLEMVTSEKDNFKNELDKMTTSRNQWEKLCTETDRRLEALQEEHEKCIEKHSKDIDEFNTLKETAGKYQECKREYDAMEKLFNTTKAGVAVEIKRHREALNERDQKIRRLEEDNRTSEESLDFMTQKLVKLESENKDLFTSLSKVSQYTAACVQNICKN
jgi:chromosome segregation ATPase